MNIIALTLTFALLCGQLLKLPVAGNSGPSILDILISILCIIGVFNLKLKFKRPPAYIFAGSIFILFLLISLLFTPLKLTSSQYLISLSYTLRFASIAFLSYLIYVGAFPKFQVKIMDTLILSGVGLAILGILQFIFIPDLSFTTAYGWDPHYFRAVSTFLDPNFFGAFMVLTLLLFLRRSHLSTEVRPLSSLEILLSSILYLALLLTFSRSSYGMFLISFLSLSVLLKSKKLFGISILLFLILMSGFYVYTKIISEPRNIDRTQSAQFRLNTWQEGFDLFQSHPILGVGFNSYRFALGQYNLAPKDQLASHGSSSNDSSLLFVAATTGVVGLISYLYFLFQLGFANFRKNFILAAAIIGLVAHSFFADSLFYPPILLWLFLIASLKI